MVASAFTAPHVTEFLTVDVTPTMELLAKLKASRAFAGLQARHPLTLVAKALLHRRCGRNPSLNTRWDEANQEIVAVQLREPRHRRRDPARADRAEHQGRRPACPCRSSSDGPDRADGDGAGRQDRPADLAGGTISITNIGVFGIDAGTPILNPGEAAILALGAVRQMPWEYQDEVALRQVMTLSLSFDHRLVDGEQGSRFLATSAPSWPIPAWRWPWSRGPDPG